MEGAFGSPARKRSVLINITPLIDVMFLLLIFFLVSSTFREQVGLDITLPSSTEAREQVYTETTVTVKNGAYAFGEQQGLSEAQIEAALREVLVQNPDQRVVLKADKQADYADYIGALSLMKRIGVRTLVLETQGVAASEGIAQ